MTRPPIGLVLGSHLAPEEIPQTARLAEELGFAELWLAEDYFFTGGISGAGGALAATSEIPVGLGIVSAMVRHPALLAMEIATLQRMHPGRVRPGIGLGVPHWVEQMELMPRSPLRAMRECVTGVKRLLAGETLTETGDYYGYREVKLTYPPTEPVGVWMGVIGPKMVELAGEVADGLVSSVLAAPQYVTWAQERLAAGRARAGRGDRQPFAAFVLYCVDRDGDAARRAIRPSASFYLHAMPRNAMNDVYGISEEAAALAQRGLAAVEAELPQAWLEDLVVAGDPGECAAKLRRLLDAGADTVVLFPAPPERAREMVELTAAEVLPNV